MKPFLISHILAEYLSVQFSHSLVSVCDPMDCSMPSFPVHHQLPELFQTHVHQVGDAIQSSVIPFSSCLQSFPASGSFTVSQFFTSGDQSLGASASVLPVTIEDWFPLHLTGLISLQSKEALKSLLQHHNLKASILWPQLSLWSNSDVHTYIFISRINLHCCVDGYNLFDQS